MKYDNEEWDIIIKPKGKKFELNLKEIWQYRDLLILYVKRDIVTMYKQTVLGPLWFLIQPIMSTIMFMFIFSKVADIPTDGIPPALFYMAGLICWQYFAECLGRSSTTFSANAGVFSKVYFPRLVVPYSGLISSLIKLGFQFLLFAVIYLYYIYQGESMSPTIYILGLPFFIAILAFLGMGIGIIVSSLTTKYRDLAILFGFIVQLWMYATPVAYPLSVVREKLSDYAWVAELNPVTPIIEVSKYALVGAGTFTWQSLAYSFIFTIVIMIIGSWVFNKVERRFIDIV